MATARKRGKSYEIRASLGYDINGKKMSKSLYWTPEAGMTPKQEAKELERQKILFDERVKSGQLLNGKIKFAEFAEKWFTDYAEKQCKKKTIARYKAMMKRINLAIGHIQLEKLQPHHLIEFYKNLAEAGIRDDTKYKPINNFADIIKAKGYNKVRLSKKAEVSIAVLHYHRLISAIFGTAVKWQVIISNPCSRVDPPKSERKEAKYLDEREAAKLLDLIETEAMQFRTMIKLLIYTGIRRGELCGLEWGDIDFENRTLHIQRNSLYLPSEGIYEDTTKNFTSDRVIKIPVVTIEMLKCYENWQIKYKLSLGDQWANTDRLFTAWNGKPIHPDTVTGQFRGFIKKHNLPNISVHSLRHTNATLMIASGTPLATIQKRLGHAQQTTTANIYSHAIRSADEVAAETLEDILNPPTAKLKKHA